MSKADPLFLLIKSLQPAEKRYFKRFADFHIEQDRNRYVRLFELMERQEEYDEAAVKQAFRSKLEVTFAQNLSFNKKYLYQLLLKCLRNYHGRRSARIRLHEALIDVAVLLEKGLVDQALKRIRKTRSLAAEYQFTGAALDLALQERKLVRQSTSPDGGEDFEKIRDDGEGLLRKYDQELRLLRLYEDIFRMARTGTQPEEILQSLQRSIWQVAKKTPTLPEYTFDAVAYFHLVQSQSYRLTRQPDEANEHLRRLIEHFEQHPALLHETEFQERYLNTLNNYFNNCYLLGRLDQYTDIVEKMARIEPSSPRLEAAVFHNAHYIRLVYHLQQQDYAAVVRLIDPIREGLARFGTNIPKNRELAFRYNLAVALYFERQTRDALNWIDGILGDPRQEMRQDIQLLARVFHLALHFELGHETLVANLIPNVRRLLQKHRKPESVEVTIVNTLRQAVQKDTREPFVALQEVLTKEKGWEEFKEFVARHVSRAHRAT